LEVTLPFGAVLTFDAHTENNLRALMKAQADAGLPSFMLGVDYPPHMTLFMAETVDLPGLRASLQSLAQSTTRLPVAFLSLGVFPAQVGVVFFTPVTDMPLLRLHETTWNVARPYLVNPGEHYRPGVWVPHLTMAYQLKPDEIGPVTAFLAGSAWPGTGWIEGILFGDFQVQGGSRLEQVHFVT
jgi:hypothetical protein